MSHHPCCSGFAQNLVNYMLLLPFNYWNTNVGAAYCNYTRTNSSGSYSIDDFYYCFCFHPIVDYVFYCCLGTLVNSYFSVLDLAGNYFGAAAANVRDMEAVVADLGRLTDEVGSNSAAGGNNCLLRGCLGHDGGFLLACARSADCIANSTAHGLSFN
jgi:hypothetical protein